MSRRSRFSTDCGRAGLPLRSRPAGSSCACLGRTPSRGWRSRYAALPNGGRVAPLRYRQDDREERGAAVFGPLGAWYVNSILAGAPPPPGALPVETRRGRQIAFKTGTSYGYRDFWAIGYDAEV